jgi:hypothetical protein
MLDLAILLIMGLQLRTFCFDILRRVALWKVQYDESCKLCLGGGGGAAYCWSVW